MNRTDAAARLAMMTTCKTALEVAVYHLPEDCTAAALLEAAEDASWSRAAGATDAQKAEAVAILTDLANYV